MRVCTQVTRTSDGAVLLNGNWQGISGASVCGVPGEQFSLTMFDSFGDGQRVLAMPHQHERRIE